MPRSASALALLRRAAVVLGARALDLVYPGYCRECGAPVPGNDVFCGPCGGRVAWIASACRRCGLPAIRPGPDGCGECAARSFSFDAAIAPAQYTGPWRTAVLRFKYAGDHGLRATFGLALERAWKARFADERPDAIVPVPASAWRKLLRGRDHVDDLALDLSRRLGIPVRRALRRARWIASQTSLTRARRVTNPRDAYAMVRTGRRRRGGAARAPRSALLLDDVLTTCATASECARALREAGAERVLVLALARSPPE